MTFLLKILVVVFSVGACAPVTPAETPEGARAFRVMAPLVMALDSYKLENGTYPRALSALTPKYVSHVAYPPGIFWQEYEVVSEGEGFVLVFKFVVGGGAARCVVSSQDRRYRCEGYY